MYIDSLLFTAIGPLLLNNVKNFAEGFRCDAFQNTAGVRIEAERLSATQNFWLLESWQKIHYFIEKLCSATKLIFGSMDT